MERLLLVLACLAGSVVITTDAAAAATPAAEVRRVPVVTTAVQRRSFEERVVVQGNVEAKTTALVPARINGTLMTLFVDEGDTVKAGETALLLTDDMNLKNGLEVSRLDLAVAACGVREKQANLEREKAGLERKRKDYERQKRLFDEDKIGTLDKVEEAESEFKQSVALVAHAESLVALAEEQKNQAATAVRIAEKNLSDAKVVAPLSGVVSQRLQEVGEMGGPAKPVFRIVDLSRLEVSAYLPAQHYAAIVPGQTRVSVRVGAVEQRDRLVSYRAPTIEPQLRVFEIKCLLESPPAAVAPGAMASVSVVLRREEGLGVPKEAITKRDGKDVLFRLESDTARQAVVEVGMETDGWVQVRSEQLAEGTPVVTMGQFLLNDGVRVDLRPGVAKPTPADAPAAATAADDAPAVPAAAVRKEN